MLLLEASDTIQGVAAAATAITYTIYGNVSDGGTANSYKKLAQGQLPSSIGAIYTAPATAGTFVQIATIVLTNPTGSARTAQLNHDGTTSATVILPPISIDAGGMAVYDGSGWHFYDASGQAKISLSTGAPSGAAGGDLSGTYPNPSVVDDSHAHTTAEQFDITGGPLQLSGDISPAQITADQNDYNPTGLADAVVLRLDLDANRTITGIAGGADGRILIIHNRSLFELTLANESASSSAANRFFMGNDVIVAALSGIILHYDYTAGRWKAAAMMRQPYGSTPEKSTTAGSAGTSGRFARGNHAHPLWQEHIAIWTIAGTLPASKTGTLHWTNRTGRTLTFIDAIATVGTAPSGGSVTCDIEDSGGTSILNANLVITTGNTTDTETTFAGGGTLANGATLHMDLDSTTAPAADLVVMLLMRG